jgi:dTDP-4-amino-4,6-dideoxygalactose transaminase
MEFINLKKEYEFLENQIDDAVLNVLASGNYIGGKEVELFEKELAEYHNIKYAISCANGTDALFLSLKALGIGEGDEVITTPFTFIATAGAIVNVGAKPVFVDINYDDFNINIDLIEEKITSRTKAIIPVHLFGKQVEMNKLMELAKKHSIYIVEDAAQSFGLQYQGTCSCLSFYPTKNLAGMGDGGAILTNNKELNDKIRMLKNHGIGETYVSEVIGINSRLDSIQAAILRVRLKYLDKSLKIRKENAKYYCEQLGIEFFEDSTYNQFTVRIQNREYQYFDFPTKIYYPVPLHLQPAFKYLGYKEGDFPESEKSSKEVISLPLLISREEQDEVIKKIKPCLQNM